MSSFHLCVVLVLSALLSVSMSFASAECSGSELPILCHGARVARSVASMKPMKLMDGVEIVRVASSLNTSDSRRSASVGNGYVDRVLQYLQSHEIKVNVNEVMQRSGVIDAVSRAFREVEAENEVVEARKKDKSGLSTILITALMMKKMLAALGMGAIAALAAKALGVAMLALLLSSLLGLKKLSEPANHEVQYVHAEHHRKRRDLLNDDAEVVALPYRAWAPAIINTPPLH